MDVSEDTPDWLMSGYQPMSLPLYDSQSLEAEIADVLAWPDRSHQEVTDAASRAMDTPLHTEMLFGGGGAQPAPSPQQLRQEHEEAHGQAQQVPGGGAPWPLPLSLPGSRPNPAEVSHYMNRLNEMNGGTGDPQQPALYQQQPQQQQWQQQSYGQGQVPGFAGVGGGAQLDPLSMARQAQQAPMPPPYEQYQMQQQRQAAQQQQQQPQQQQQQWQQQQSQQQQTSMLADSGGMFPLLDFSGAAGGPAVSTTMYGLPNASALLGRDSANSGSSSGIHDPAAPGVQSAVGPTGGAGMPTIASSASRGGQANNSGEFGDVDDLEPERGEDRAQKIKEKNRRAQQRFRERQRARLHESQERAEALKAGLTQLRIEHDLLVARNTMLERFKAVRQTEERENAQAARLPALLGGDSQAEGSAESNVVVETAKKAAAAAAAESSGPTAAAAAAVASATVAAAAAGPAPTTDPPAAGGAAGESSGLVLTVRDGQHVTLSTEQIRKMHWQQHAKIWKEYVSRLAELLVEARSDPDTDAGRRAAVLVREAVTLAANVSIHNPRGYRTWHCNRMETANSPPEMPTREFWYSRMRSLKMPEEQRVGMRQLRRLYLGRLGDVLRKRQAIAAQMRPSTATFDGGRASIQEYLKVVDITEQLQANLVEEHKLLQMLMINITFRIGRPLQAASLIVQSYPFPPDMLAVINCLAEDEGDPSASDLLAMGYEKAVGLQKTSSKNLN
mmetsp:Transcript_15374/g.46404  ORF Transcript_15374/g.46404 Transcript_15374/m.46404 type:complete len:728 (-) Transcript_15374:3796-5979(-)